MAATDLKHVDETGPAAGIDRSPSPKKGSVWDACNLSTCDGVWKTRPGFHEVRDVAAAPIVKHLGEAEYTHDKRFDTSHYYSIICSIVTGSNHYFFEFHNSEEAAVNITPTPAPAQGYRRHWTHARTLYRFLKDNGDADYAPCIVWMNGKDHPLVYHQKDGTGTMEELDALDGGGTDISYLTTVPNGKYVFRAGERLFALNIEGEAGNRYYMTTVITGTNSWTGQVWPASYNGDIGPGDKELTGGAEWRGMPVMFKENEIWTLSGDGVDGKYQPDCVDSHAGAINQDCVVNVGDSLLFFNRSGAYRWAGGAAKRISHPALKGVWEQYHWGEGEHKHPHAVYDEAHRRVLFVTGQDTKNLLSTLVYNLDTGTWDRWGEWPGNPSMSSIIPYDATLFPERIFQVRNWETNKVSVMGLVSGYLLMLDDRFEFDHVSSSNYPIHWYIRTHRYFLDDESKLLRRVMVYSKLTGNWQMSVLPLVDGQSTTEALRHGIQEYNTIVDSANATEHLISGESNFQTAADGPVDVYFTPVLHKLFDSRVLVASTDDEHIKFSANLNSINMAGTLLVIPEDTARIKFLEMAPEFYLGAAGSKVGDALAEGSHYQKITVAGMNRIGKSFALFLSNVGSYTDQTNYCKPVACDIKGWGLWIRPRGVVR